jgi:hypothetical protein
LPKNEGLGSGTAAGVSLPPVPLPEARAEWIGARALEGVYSGREIREYVSPVIEAGERVAHVRIGFFHPGYEVCLAQASFLVCSRCRLTRTSTSIASRAC